MLSLADALLLLGFVETLILLLYAGRFYLFSITVMKHRFPPRVQKVETKEYPFVSVLLPTYNEQNVIDRLLRCCTDFDYSDYEIVVIDDSIDDTVQLLQKWKSHPRVKVIHRNTRKGWKGGALNTGLERIDPKSTHILILDADFIPPPDLLQQFLERFSVGNVAAGQGYQVHDLNADENWITRGIRVMFSLNNMVELNAKQHLKSLIPITGSVYMVRTEILKQLRFQDCLTEDWALTLSLYMSGYKVIFDPSIRASAECSNTLFKFFRQNMRWAEGHTRYLVKNFTGFLRSTYPTTREKAEFILLGGVYLNSLLILLLAVGGILLLPSLDYALASWPAWVGLSLTSVEIFSTFVSSIVAITVEGNIEDITSVPNALVLGLITTPFTAYAILRGLIAREGVFHRTYKTGKITKTALIDRLSRLGRRLFGTD
jgi:cellulose synthase/poly-beta-1,6-N-acetylglucosamine synthase-like glycosyltransferase